MKKLLSLLLAFACSLSVFGQCVSTVYDDFESGAMNGAWTQGGGYSHSFPTVGAPEGTTYMQHTGGSNTHYNGDIWTFATSTPSYISWWGMTPTNTSNSGYVVIGDASTSSNNGIVFFYFTSMGTMRFYNNTTNFETPAIANTWYHFEMMNVNFTNHTYDLYINGVMVQAGYAFRSLASSNINQIHLYNYDGSVVGNYDQVVIGAMPLTMSATHTDVSCFGANDGTVTADVLSGVQPYTYAWSNGGTIDSLGALSAGTYIVTVTASNGCTVTDTLIVTEPTALSHTDTLVAPTCSYNTDGSISLAVSGGTPGYSYLWSTGDTTQNLSNVGDGSYTVVYTDANGCFGSDTLQLVAPAVLTFTCLPEDVLCAGGSDGSLTLTPSGGSGGYTYLWSTGDSTSTLTGLVAGAYSVTMMDVNGCVHSDTFVVAEPAALASSGTVINDDGSSIGAIDLTVTGGTSPYAFLWSNGATTEDLSSIPSGTYVVTVTDANGCTHTESFTVDLVIAVGGRVELAMKAWPNPFSNELKLQLPITSEPISLQLFGLQGELVLKQMVDGGELLVLNTQDLAQGSYFLVVRAGNAVQTVRVTKVN